MTEKLKLTRLFQADEEFELGTSEDPLVAEEDVEIVVDGYDSLRQNFSVTEIYGTEHISLSSPTHNV